MYHLVCFSNNTEALIAENLEEIISLVDEVNRDGKKNVKFAFEASTCGGIPIIHALQSSFKGDIINEVMGICNGTTNYMLGKMEEVRYTLFCIILFHRRPYSWCLIISSCILI